MILLAFVLVASVGGVAIVGGATTVGGAVAASKPGTSPSTLPSNNSPLDAAASALDDNLSHSATTDYAGLNVSANENGIVIHVVGQTSTSPQSTVPSVGNIVQSTLASLPAIERVPASNISYVPATISMATMLSEQQSVTNNISVLDTKGVDVTMWGPDVLNDTLDVHVYKSVSEATSDIAAVLGSENFTLIQDSQPMQPANKTTDNTPWWGGDLLNVPGGGTCTSGFSMVNSSGATYNSTAGHCGYGTYTQNGQGYGVSVSIYYCNGCNGDTQLVSTYPNTSAPYVFTGLWAYEAVGTQTGTLQIGFNSCFDGYVTTSHNNWQVPCAPITGINQNIQYQNGWIIHKLAVTNKDGSWLAALGDSGGPVYNYNASSLNAQGMIDAVGNCAPDGPPPPVPCAAVAFMPIYAVEFALGVNIQLTG